MDLYFGEKVTRGLDRGYDGGKFFIKKSVGLFTHLLDEDQGIEIKNISINSDKTEIIKVKSNLKTDFKYIIRIADLYFEDSANILAKRLHNEYNIININVKKMSENRYRVYKGPYYNLDSIKNEYNDIIKVNFENIEIIKL